MQIAMVQIAETMVNERHSARTPTGPDVLTAIDAPDRTR